MATLFNNRFLYFLQNLWSETMLEVFGFNKFLRVGDACSTLGVSHSLLFLRYLQPAPQQRRSVWHSEFSGFLSVSVGGETLIGRRKKVFWLTDFLLIRLHFDVSNDPSASGSFSCSYTPSNPYCDSPIAPSSPSDLSNVDAGFYGAHNQHLNSSGSTAGSMTGMPQQPRQKGRPRKRKPKDIEAMTANLGESKRNCFENVDLYLKRREVKSFQLSFDRHEVYNLRPNIKQSVEVNCWSLICCERCLKSGLRLA